MGFEAIVRSAVAGEGCRRFLFVSIADLSFSGSKVSSGGAAGLLDRKDVVPAGLW